MRIGKIMNYLIKAAAAIVLSITAFSAGAVTVKSFEADSMGQIVEARKGKPFVVVLWSLDCEYCTASLETLARVRQQRQDLNVVTIATDAMEDPTLRLMIEKRLSKFGMTEDAWAFGGPPERLRYAIDRRWHGEMPRSYWFNAKGEKTLYSGVITPAVINKLYAR